MPTTRQRVLRRAATIMLMIGCTLPTAAHAGTYHHWGCRTPSGAPAPALGWTSTEPAATVSSCSTGGSFGVVAGNASGQASAAATYELGTGLTATSATLWRTANATQSVSHGQAPSFPWAVFTLSVGSATAGSGYDSIETGLGDKATAQPWDPIVGTTIGSTIAPFSPANRVVIAPVPTAKPAAPLRISTGCIGWPGWTCDASYLLSAYDIVLRDDLPPTVGAAAGTLLEGGKPIPVVTGTRSALVLGADVGSGLLRASIEIDGQLATTSAVSPPTDPNRCAPELAADGMRAYLAAQPCPLSGSATVSWDSTTVNDGSHDVRVLWEDAAGNTTVVAAGRVLVRNESTVGPGSPDEIRGTPNGSMATDAANLSLVWPETERKPSRKPTVIRRCRQPSYAAKHPLACSGQAARAEFTTDWSREKGASALGRLTDPGGRPIANATVTVTTTPTATGATTRPWTTVVTDADGVFSLSVPRAAGSQVITAEWMARTSDTRAAATASARLIVRAATSLSAPRRVSRAAQVTFSGALRGAAGTLQQVPITLLVRDGGRWKTFATASTDGSGKWATTVKFSRTPGTYAVRASVGSVPTYPFAPGAGTRTVRVRVR